MAEQYKVLKKSLKKELVAIESDLDDFKKNTELGKF